MDIHIVTSIAVRPIGRALIMYVETIKTDVIVFIGIIHDNLKSHCSLFSSIDASLLILTISLSEIKLQINVYSGQF